MIRLENWRVNSGGIHGKICGHPGFADGTEVTLGLIAEVEEIADNGFVIKTESGSTYTLGEPAPDYKQKFPNAKVRMVQALKGAFHAA